MNEDEFAAFLETGETAAGAAGRPSRSDQAAERIRRELAAEGTWAEPPGDGADRLLAAVRAEPGRSGSRPASNDAGDADEGVDDDVDNGSGSRAQQAGFLWRRPLLVAAAAAVLVLLVGAVAVIAGSAGTDRFAQPEFAVTGTELAPEAWGTVRIDDLTAGVAVELYVHDLAPAEPGTYYQGWVETDGNGNGEGEGDERVSVGTFHMRGGDGPVELWSGVTLDDYPTLAVTLQEEGAGPESSGRVVLSGRIAP